MRILPLRKLARSCIMSQQLRMLACPSVCLQVCSILFDKVDEHATQEEIVGISMRSQLVRM